jgi:hypothetical protein
MKAKDVKCKCGGAGELHGSDPTNEYGPFLVACKECGEETAVWCLPRLAWKSWKMMNLMKVNLTINFGTR